MKAKTPETPPEQVIAWLRSPEGEAWSREQYIGFSGRITRSIGRTGLFADVLPDGTGTAETRMCQLGDGADIEL